MARIRLALVTALILNFSTALANDCQKCISGYNTGNYVSMIKDWIPFQSTVMMMVSGLRSLDGIIMQIQSLSI